MSAMPSETPGSYGYFTEDGSEYVITSPFTPRPWINYLTNGEYCALCSHRGGGFSFYLHHHVNSILRRGAQPQQEDMPGRLFYIKDEDTGEIWTANVTPFEKVDTFEARHGMATTTITSSYSKIGCHVRYFVGPGLNAELWDLTVTNQGTARRRLSVYSYADFVLGNVSQDELCGAFMPLFNDVELRGDKLLMSTKWWHTKYGWAEETRPWPLRAFAVPTKTPVSILTDREAFFGAHRSFSNPAALNSEVMPNSVVSGRPLAAVFQWRVALEPGESWRTQVAIGVQPHEDSAANTATLDLLTNPKFYDEMWDKTRAYWESMLGSVTIETPEPELNRFFNYWSKFQAMVNLYYGRGPSYYHKEGYQGMRDCCQDTFGMVVLNTEMARANIKRIAQFYMSDGRCCGACNRIGNPEGPASKADQPLWLILAAADYVRETGDYALLDESVPFMDGGESTIYQKLIGGIDRMLNERGEHGLPLIGDGDWNDAANGIGKEGKGESVWLAQFLYLVIGQMTPIMKKRKDTAKLDAYTARAAEIKSAVNEHCWDGDWFVRAFKDDGTPVGVKGQEEGLIWINSQTWAVISGVSDPERLNKCMDSAEKHLGTDYGMMNLGPAYTKLDPTIGNITAFLPGWKENAAIFSHASSFNVVARAMLGRGNDAMDLYRRILPFTKNSDTYLVEPYAYAQFTVGPGSPDDFGRGSFHWMTGTAAWMFRAMTDYIMGVRATPDGLVIIPAIDPSWDKFALTRRFRGTTYHIAFQNPDHVESGVKQVTLDGIPISGNVLPLPTAKDHTVVVVMGQT